MGPCNDDDGAAISSSFEAQELYSWLLNCNIEATVFFATHLNSKLPY